MSAQVASVSRHSIDRAVRVLCPLIEDRLKGQLGRDWQEADLRRELVGCILGSQVRHEMAVTATENLESAGLMADRWWCCRNIEGFGSRVFDVLSGSGNTAKPSGRYRFPSSRARQLASARDAIAQLPLRDRVLGIADPFEMRRRLITDIPGLGPKQASMFLRNIGRSYDLAIIDVHVLRFLRVQDILLNEKTAIGSLRSYELIERKIVEYADSLGFPAGYLDWAIWATMKAAQELWQ